MPSLLAAAAAPLGTVLGGAVEVGGHVPSGPRGGDRIAVGRRHPDEFGVIGPAPAEGRDPDGVGVAGDLLPGVCPAYVAEDTRFNFWGWPGP